MCASAPRIGAPSAMSSDLPCGRPSTTSKMVTSPSSRYAASWARTPPMFPPPINEILLRAMVGGIPLLSALALRRARLRLLLRRGLASSLLRRRRLLLRGGLHVGDDRIAELRALQQLRALHQPVEVVGDALRGDRARDALLDQVRGLVPA